MTARAEHARLIGCVTATLLLALAATILGGASYTPRTAAWWELGSGIVLLGSVLPAFGAARRTTGRLRLSWASLGFAMLMWGANLLILDGTMIIDGETHGIAVASALQVVAVALVLLTLPLQPRAPWEPGWSSRIRLDVAVIVLSLLLIYAVVVVRHVLDGPGTAALKAFALSYPVATLGMTAFAYTMCRRGSGRPRPEQALLVVGFAFWVISGSTYALMATTIDVSPPVVSCLFACGVVAFGYAAHLVGRPAIVPAVSERSARVLTSLPEGLIVLATLIGMARGLDSWLDWSLAALTGLAIFVRASRLAVQARRSRDTLEQAVVDRTEAFTRLDDRHTSILSTVDDGIIGVDPEDRITFVNSSAERLLGIESDQVLGLPACEVLCVSETERCPLRRDEEMESSRLETRFRARGGVHLPVDVTVAWRTPTADGGGGAVVAFRDVSERQRVEQIKRQFISSVSHELRTPLTSIRGVLEMLADGDAGELPGPAHQLLTSAQRGSERLSRLVDDIIDMERLATGDFSVVPVPTEIDGVVLHAIASLEGLAAVQDVQVRTGALGGIAWCDPDRVEQALVNLIGNAVKFSPEQGTVLVTAEERDGEVLISVGDHGRGIPADELTHIFERFRQVHVSDATDKGGSGLGLTITRSIVERHGGQIWVDSVEGEGTVFSMTLPQVASEPVEAALAQLPALSAQEARA